MALSNFAALASSSQSTGAFFSNHAPVSNLNFSSHLAGGRTVCGSNWGDWKRATDCLNAVAKLPTGSSEVPYVVDRGLGPHILPQSAQSGDCQIQIELAGEGTPPTFALIPDDIRAMATNLIGWCTKEERHIGGFTFGDLHDMIGWLSSSVGNLDAYQPPYTAFPTISISTPQGDYMSPGNYDPLVAHVLAQALFDIAKKLPPNSHMAVTLRAKANRLLAAEKNMEPRGRRIAWWVDPKHPPRLENPMTAGNATADALAGDSAGMVTLPGSGGSVGSDGTQTARKARRKRRTVEIEAA